ncbi:DUF4333 domain-containing protein [Saccharothrix coeruleofusca]|nr:DUF4333 domain-containing protein [Saccharothrix coeruleofusca]MBP2336966.1 hypothetical protein [Saccharothrix coeruleofusca]
MTSPYGPSGGNDPQPQWGQQPYGGGYPGTPSGGFPAQQPGYGQPDPSQQSPQQPQWGQQPPPQQPYTQQYPGAYDPTQSNPYGQPAQGPYGQQPYGQQPYGQPGYGPQPPAKKSSAVLWVVVALAVLVVGAVGITGFVTPGFLNTKVFDNTAVQNGIVQVLKDDYKIADVESASCTGEHEVKPNTTFDCTVKVGDKDKKVKITVKTADGEYEVGQPTG